MHVYGWRGGVLLATMKEKHYLITTPQASGRIHRCSQEMDAATGGPGRGEPRAGAGTFPFYEPTRPCFAKAGLDSTALKRNRRHAALNVVSFPSPKAERRRLLERLRLDCNSSSPGNEPCDSGQIT